MFISESLAFFFFPTGSWPHCWPVREAPRQLTFSGIVQLPAPAVPRVVCEEQQIHGTAAGVKVSRLLLPTELTDGPPVGIDLVGEERGSSLQCRYFPTGLGWWWW